MLGGAAKISGDPGAEAKEQTWTGAERLGEQVVDVETEAEERRELRRGDDGRTVYAALSVGGGWRGGRVSFEGAVSNTGAVKSWPRQGTDILANLRSETKIKDISDHSFF